MAKIQFLNAGVEIPIFNSSSRSLKNRLIKVATGGRLRSDDGGHVVVRALQDLSFTFSDRLS